MNTLMDFVRQLGAHVLRLVLLLAAMVFAFSLVLAALLLVAGVSTWSLLTGRKPAPWVLFQRLRERSRFGGVRARAGGPSDVVDVQATEVAETPGAATATGAGPSGPVPDASGAAR